MSAEKMQGILNVAEPDFNIVMMVDGKRLELHLWVNKNAKYGMFTYVTDSGQGYRLTEESTRALYDLIWSLTYTPEQAEANGDVVESHGKLLNQHVWEGFIANVKEDSLLIP